MSRPAGRSLLAAAALAGLGRAAADRATSRTNGSTSAIVFVGNTSVTAATAAAGERDLDFADSTALVGDRLNTVKELDMKIKDKLAFKALAATENARSYVESLRTMEAGQESMSAGLEGLHTAVVKQHQTASEAVRKSLQGAEETEAKATSAGAAGGLAAEEDTLDNTRGSEEGTSDSTYQAEDGSKLAAVMVYLESHEKNNEAVSKMQKAASVERKAKDQYDNMMTNDALSEEGGKENFKSHKFHTMLEWQADVQVDLHMSSSATNLTAVHAKAAKKEDITSRNDLPEGSYNIWATYSSSSPETAHAAPQEGNLTSVEFLAGFKHGMEFQAVHDHLKWAANQEFDNTAQSMLLFSFDVKPDGNITWKHPGAG